MSARYLILFIAFFQISLFCKVDLIEIDIPSTLIQNVYPVDINGDGNTDLIVQHNQIQWPRNETQRITSIFYQSEGRFQTQPDISRLADQNDILFDWADMNQDGWLEIGFIQRDSILLWDPHTNTTQVILQTSSRFTDADSDQLPHWPFLYDLNLDKKPEIVLPVARGYQTWQQDINGCYQPAISLCASFQHNFITDETLGMQTWLPRMVLGNMDGGQIQDIIFILENKLALFFSPFTGKTKHEKSLSPDDTYQFSMENADPSMLEAIAPADVQLELQDLNRDGFDDVILSRASRASFTKTSSQLQIYFNHNASFNALPDQVLMADNFFGDHIVADLNYDGRLDLALLQFPIGLVGAAKFLITRKMKYGFDIYYQNRDGTYSDTPDRKLRYTRHSKIRNVLRPEMATFTDWNGDGLPDLIVNLSLEKIVCFFQKPNGEFPKKPNIHMTLPVSIHHWFGYLNKDNRSDMILWYSGSGRIRCIINRNDS